MKSLYAVCLLVKNLEKSLAFYKGVLELEVNSSDDGYVDFKLNDTLLAIFQSDKAGIMFPREHMNTGGGAVYAYQVKDVDKACKDLINKGVEIFEGPKMMPWGQTVAYFKDPDNNIWEVTV